MSELRERIEREAEKLKQRRDELRVQLDLGKKEVGDLWQEADERWSRLEAHLRRLKDEGQDALEDVGDAASLLLDEIREGFSNIKKLL